MSGVVVVHDVGDPFAGAPWRSALAGAGVDAFACPDLPGHGDAPAPANGSYDASVGILAGRRAIADLGDPAPIVVGCGENAYAACVLAAAGLANALVVVDGLGGSWRTPEEDVAAMYARIRAIANDADAVAPPPPRGLDPRAAHGYGMFLSAELCQRLWRAITVPVLAVETPRSATPPAERAERTGWFGGRSALVTTSDASPSVVVEAVLTWAHA